jgi:hypothetical protein
VVKLDVVGNDAERFVAGGIVENTVLVALQSASCCERHLIHLAVRRLIDRRALKGSAIAHLHLAVDEHIAELQISGAGGTVIEFDRGEGRLLGEGGLRAKGETEGGQGD